MTAESLITHSSILRNKNNEERTEGRDNATNGKRKSVKELADLIDTSAKSFKSSEEQKLSIHISINGSDTEIAYLLELL